MAIYGQGTQNDVGKPTAFLSRAFDGTREEICGKNQEKEQQTVASGFLGELYVSSVYSKQSCSSQTRLAIKETLSQEVDGGNRHHTKEDGHTSNGESALAEMNPAA